MSQMFINTVKYLKGLMVISLLIPGLFFEAMAIGQEEISDSNSTVNNATKTTETTKTKTEKTAKVIQRRKGPLIIQSQVKGSQEQPNVIYIMPWQGIESPITIENNKRKITLPTFKPVNPNVFKAQVALFSGKGSDESTEENADMKGVDKNERNKK